MPDIDIKFKDNSRMTLEVFHKACARGLVSIGSTAERHAKNNCPVDTGRLRGSITYATSASHSAGEPPSEPPDYATHGAPESFEVYIGTNVEYAPFVELGTSRNKAHHMLKRAASEHSDEYKKLMEDSLKNA